jgi:AhpD family alkylhydroperoxidase
MKPRLDFEAVAPDGDAAMTALHHYVGACGLDRALVELVSIRASQINGCAFCLAMHAPMAREAGVTQAKLDTLSAWREQPSFSLRERAALAWTDAVTLIADGQAPDDVYAEARRQFGEKELVDLTLAIVNINGWNRLMAAFRATPPS